MKKRYLIIIAVLALGSGLVGLGMTRNHVVTAAQQIIAKDKAGDDTKADIAALTDYVHSHSRASVAFSLDGSYQRAAQAAQAAATPTANSSVYNAAIAACQVKNPVATAQCIQNYVQSHAAPGAQPKPVVLPDHKLYEYQITAPNWAPDVAGISFLVALLALVVPVWLWLFGRASRPSY